MKAQSSATLSSTRVFSARAVKIGLARTRCSQTVPSSKTNCVGTTTGRSRPGPPGATRWPNGWEVTNERHSSSPRVASAGAMNMRLSLAQDGRGPRPEARGPRRRGGAGAQAQGGAGADSARGAPGLVHRLGPVALVVDLAVGRTPDGGHGADPPGRLVRGQLLLHVGDQFRLGRGSPDQPGWSSTTATTCSP